MSTLIFAGLIAVALGFLGRTLYRRFVVPAGRHALRVRVSEAPRPGARAWERAEALELAPGRVLTIDFRPEQGGILFL